MNVWHRFKDNKPPNKGTYITLNLPKDYIESFEQGKYKPGPDDISADYFNGENFVWFLNGCEYIDDKIDYWMQITTEIK